MIDIKRFKKAEMLAPENCIQLSDEKDFMEFLEKQENKGYLFVDTEYHPENEKKIIAHNYYVFDLPSGQWFNFEQLLIPKDEYDSIQEKEEESTPSSLSGEFSKQKMDFLREFIKDRKVDSSWIEYPELIRYAREKGIKCPILDNERHYISRAIETEPDLDDLIQKNSMEKQKEIMAKAEEVATIVSTIPGYKEAPTASMKRMIIKRYLLENNLGELTHNDVITNIKNLADIK